MSKPVEKQEWFRVAEAFEASGLTQKEFSQHRGVRLSTLQSWVYRRDAEGGPGPYELSLRRPRGRG
ncbi:IS66 family insertion sequence element accessory protein TnpA [Myxococcus xanthus]|uniref:IS66 family insertion sequence element accessory protein TnpA n=1 Tax=Myxococcus xanthus TaxID=34 RepID=UPI000942358D